MIDVAGIEQAVALVKALGGRAFYLGKRPGPDHPVAHVIGLSVLRDIIARELVSTDANIVIPMRGFDVRRQMQVQMIEAAPRTTPSSRSRTARCARSGACVRALRRGDVLIAGALGPRPGAAARDDRQVHIDDLLEPAARGGRRLSQ
ncbi:MAG: hypothetical protein WDN08_05430 [Rhizomicrobium sp.]